MRYNFKKIESKWQKKWEEKKIFQVKESKKKKKYYVLEQFPYPSSSGLHVGHTFIYTIGDVYARFKRMNGFNVLYPMGFDSFGLPAENAAIKVKSHPKKFTEDAIKNFIKQLKSFGNSYDWDRIVETHKPNFYKWDQWIFLKMYEKGLAYRKKAPVNFCKKCNTVLANEQVVNGRCWRHEDTEVQIKHLEQWFLKITDYADELYQTLDTKLKDWPRTIRTLQKNWIGKSEGAEIDFGVKNPDNKISNVVIVHGSNSTEKDSKEGLPENERHWKLWIKDKLKEKGISVSNQLYPKDWNPSYEEWKRIFEKNKIDENSILVGHSAGGAFLVRWLGESKRKVRKLILVSPGKAGKESRKTLSDLYGNKTYGGIGDYVSKGIVVFTSDDDIPSHLIGAYEYGKELPAKVIELKNHGHFTLGDMGTEEFPELLDKIVSEKEWPIFTTRLDTIYGVTFMVISAQHFDLMNLVTKKQKKEVEKFLKKIKTTKNKGLDKFDKEGVFTGSYAINPINNEKIPVYAGNFVVADYGSGMVMGVPAHDQRDFEFAKKYNLKIKQVVKSKDNKNSFSGKVYTDYGVLVNSKEFNDLHSYEAKEHIIKTLERKKLGRKKINFKLRDWLISRQRFWGTPIPIVYCGSCGIIPVKEKDLPVKLPDNIKFTSVKNPLVDYKKFVETKCPKCKGKAKRETDTMDTFVNSSWYFLRYCDSKNDKKIFDSKKINYWMPIDMYIGGKEHAVMHDIYFRFYTKFLRDLGILSFDEPALRLFNQGFVYGSDGRKMSKSYGNVVLLEDVAKKYGVDSTRLFLMSVASPDKDFIWSDNGVKGSMKFTNKVFEFFNKVKFTPSSKKIQSKLNKTIKEVTEEIENLKYNLSIIKLRSLFDYLNGKEISKRDLESCVKLLSPFCPHIAEELWEKLGNKNFISLEKWPKYDKKKIDENLEKQEKIVEKLISDINHVVKLVNEKQDTEVKKVFVYVLPNEKNIFEDEKEIIRKKINLDMQIYSVNEKDKYDPQRKSKKVKPGKPGIYLE